MSELFHYSSFLKSRMPDAADKKKGERTRDRLKFAAVKLLNKSSYQSLRVSDICKAAKVSPGAFYLYFENKVEITHDILADFVKSLYSALEEQPSGTPYSIFTAANRIYLKSARANAGLVRCMRQFDDEEPKFANFRHEMHYHWHLKLAEAISAKHTEPKKGLTMFFVNVLGAMMDELVHRLVVSEDPFLTEAIDAVGLTDDTLAEALALVWHRCLYNCDPSEPFSEEVRHFVGSEVFGRALAR